MIVAPLQRESNDILLSYPRSGNSFVRYFLESVTGRPSWGYNNLRIIDGKYEIDPSQPLDAPLTGIDIRWSNSQKDVDDILESEWQPYDSADGRLMHWGQTGKMLVDFKTNIRRRFDQDFWYGKPIFKRHWAGKSDRVEDWTFDNFKDNLILLLRNPMECILRRYIWESGFKEMELETLTSFFTTELNYYYENILVFDHWIGNKSVIYFEDIVQSESAPYFRIGEFFNIDKQIIINFLADIDQHREWAATIYHALGGMTPSFRKPIDHYQSGIPDDFKIYIQKMIIDRRPPQIEKYLSRYESCFSLAL